jgi:hypothetical protein
MNGAELLRREKATKGAAKHGNSVDRMGAAAK